MDTCGLHDCAVGLALQRPQQKQAITISHVLRIDSVQTGRRGPRTQAHSDLRSLGHTSQELARGWC